MLCLLQRERFRFDQIALDTARQNPRKPCLRLVPRSISTACRAVAAFSPLTAATSGLGAGLGNEQPRVAPRCHAAGAQTSMLLLQASVLLVPQIEQLQRIAAKGVFLLAVFVVGTDVIPLGPAKFPVHRRREKLAKLRVLLARASHVLLQFVRLELVLLKRAAVPVLVAPFSMLPWRGLPGSTRRPGCFLRTAGNLDGRVEAIAGEGASLAAAVARTAATTAPAHGVRPLHVCHRYRVTRSARQQGSQRACTGQSRMTRRETN
mmetsp:Transcript_28230/g.71650  ORF Transcript_28230/g.71650 Transcript_28230/m.71650 type:complete len:263 (-) Transcript_28230:18-806(-)